MSDDKLRLESSRGQRAKEWLSNPLYEEAWEAGRQAALKKLEDLPLSDAAGREEIHHMLSAMNKVKRYIEKAVDTGRMAEIQLSSGSVVTKIKRSFA